MNNTNCEDEEIDLIDYMKVIYKYRKMIVSLMLVSMLFAGFLSLLTPETYEASAAFFPLDVNYNIKQQGVAIEPRLNIGDLVISILKSRKMAERIIDELNLKKEWGVSLNADAQNILFQATKIRLDRSGLIKLDVQTSEPQLSANIANAYVDNLDYFNQDLDLNVQRRIVQVIDRAAVPEKRMPRGTVGRAISSAFLGFVFSVLLAFLIEFYKKNNVKERLMEDGKNGSKE